jgi:16S rRNA processing protein RimM
MRLEEGRRQGQGIVVRLKGINDRNLASTYSGAEIRVRTAELPELPEGEYYWHQLEGLSVVTQNDECLGKVHHLMETGANDVLVVRATADSIDQRERLIPYLPDQVLKEVDLNAARIVVDWDPEF